MAALGNNDGVLTLASVLDSPVGDHARDVFGFYADHTSLLSTPLAFRRLDLVLAAELNPTLALPSRSCRGGDGETNPKS